MDIDRKRNSTRLTLKNLEGIIRRSCRPSIMISHEICITCKLHFRRENVSRATILLTSLHACFWILLSCKAISVFSVTIPAACLLTVAQSAAGHYAHVCPDRKLYFTVSCPREHDMWTSIEKGTVPGSH